MNVSFFITDDFDRFHTLWDGWRLLILNGIVMNHKPKCRFQCIWYIRKGRYVFFFSRWNTALDIIVFEICVHRVFMVPNTIRIALKITYNYMAACLLSYVYIACCWVSYMCSPKNTHKNIINIIITSKWMLNKRYRCRLWLLAAIVHCTTHTERSVMNFLTLIACQ